MKIYTIIGGYARKLARRANVFILDTLRQKEKPCRQ